jgi:hypothetical protein
MLEYIKKFFNRYSNNFKTEEDEKKFRQQKLEEYRRNKFFKNSKD